MQKQYTKDYEVGIHPDGYRGYFWHNKYGEDSSGRLFFEWNDKAKCWSLTDFDGAYYLSEQVLDALLSMNIRIEDSFFLECMSDG
jgi:hypothetical protein